MGTAVSKGQSPSKNNPEKEELDKSKRSASDASYGSTDPEGRSGVRRNSSVYLKRTSSTATTDRPFERQFSKASSLPSGKSLASVRTRLTSVSRSEYHTDLKPTLESGINVNLIFTTFIIVFGSSFQFGYNIGVLNNPKNLIKDFYNKTYTERYGSMSEGSLTFLWGLTTAIFLPGGMVGAFLGGWFADKVGRKRSILFSHLFAFLGAAISCACVASKAPEMLMLGRFLVGVNSGFGNCIAPIFLSEIAPFNLRGAFGTVHQLFVTIGIFLGSVFGLKEILGTAELWPYLILLEIIPAATSLIILPFLPETPRFLLLIRGDRDAAQKALTFYRRTDDVSTDMEEMDTEHQHSAGGEAFSLKQLFTSRDLRLPLFVACMLQVVQQFSGINAVFFYSSTIFEAANVPDEQIPYAVIGTNAVNVFMTIISVLIMDMAGRRLLLLVPMAVMIVDLAVITISLSLQSQASWLAYLSIACIIIYVIGFAVGLGPIPMMIGAELFRQGPRPAAMSAAGVVNWVFTFIIAIGYEPLQFVVKQYTFLIFLGLMIVFFIFVYLKVPETKNKTFEEISHQFSPGEHIQVEEIEEVFDEDPFPALPNEDEDGEDHALVTIDFGGKKNIDGEAPIANPEELPLQDQSKQSPAKGIK